MGANVRVFELELDNFKSFGKKTVIPFAEGFTTISGPNGSGKSNILDAILFVLGLTTSKTLRAERLPDLINNQQTERKQASVTFRLSVEPDDGAPARVIEITRTIRVSTENYTSTYYLDGKATPLSRIHEELSKLNISPRGNNIILQGDVTQITTMSPLERRRIIDDLAGVAEFDSRIEAARVEMDKATRHMEDLGIVADEIAVRLKELDAEKDRALRYGSLRDRKAELEAVILVAERNDLDRKLRAVDRDVEKLDADATAVRELFPALAKRIDGARAELDAVEAEIRATGEDERLERLQELEETKGAIHRQEEAIAGLRRQMGDLERTENARAGDEEKATREIGILEAAAATDRAAVAGAEEAIRVRQDELRGLYARLEDLNVAHAGQAEKLTTLRNRVTELRLDEGRQAVALAEAERRAAERAAVVDEALVARTALVEKRDETAALVEDGAETRTALAEEVDRAQRKVDGTRWEITRVRQERDRLEAEFRDLYREFTQEEARSKVATQMKTDRAVKTVLESGIKGIHGTVAELLSVPSEYQVATEVAAGKRLLNVVVDDEATAGRCIDLLKSEKAGRVTFLPLNKVKGQAPDHMLRLEGTRGYLLDLMTFKPRFADVMAHVFGATVVAEDLDRAMQLIGQFRMVTLEGELLERSGAITGGSLAPGQRMRLAVDLEGMRRRMTEKETEGRRCMERLQALETEAEKATEYLDGAKKNLTALDMELQRDRNELTRIDGELAGFDARHETIRAAAAAAAAERDALAERHGAVAADMEAQEAAMAELEATLGGSELETVHRRTGVLETEIRELNDRIRDLHEKIRLADLESAYHGRNREGWAGERVGLEARRKALAAEVEDHQARTKELVGVRKELEKAIAGIADRIGAFKGRRDESLAALEALRSERLDLEARIRSSEDRRVVFEERQRELRAEIAELDAEIATRPAVDESLPRTLTPTKIRREIGEIEEEMRAMEPVNMRALEQHRELSDRAGELSGQLATLQEEKRELKSRMTSFGRQKYEAFMATFRQVQQNYVGIYAELSDGEGQLMLENDEDPFAGGLLIKARPRGKKMERLEGLSGGEKSLSALAFVFAFQSHNPAPFYVFDEVDMFLDGMNTERLAEMVRRQSATTQFLVVSLRRAMLQRSHRTIGVTQTRTGFSQVTGLELARFANDDDDGKNNAEQRSWN